MDEIMKAKDVAKYLRISLITVYKHTKLGIIPAFRIGGAWRYSRSEIEKMMEGK